MGLGNSSLRRELNARDEEIAELRAKLAALEKTSKKTEEDAVSEFLVPFTSQALLGSSLGYAAGYALRFVGRMASVAVGSAFILLQGLSYLGIVEVDWRKVEREYIRRLDKDEDGVVGKSDVEQLWREFSDVLAFNLPAGGAFTGGLLYGLRFVPAGAAMGVATLGSLGARFLIPRVAIGGASATGLPALLVTAKRHYFGDDDFGFEGLSTVEEDNITKEQNAANKK